MKKIIILFVLFTLTTALNTAFASVMQDDSLELKTEYTKGNPLVVRGITSDGDTLYIKGDTTKKVTITKTRQIGPFKQEWSEEVDVDIDIEGINFNNIASSFFGGFFNNITNIVTVIMLFYFIIIVAIVILIIYLVKSNQKREKQKNELIMKCIESGQPIPEQLKRNTNTKERYFKNGIMWLLIGIGLIFVIGPLAAVPICVGIAYLVLYSFEKK